MLAAAGKIDRVAHAQVIETVWPRRVLAPCQQQRIDQARIRQRLPAATLELGIEKCEIEHRIVSDHGRIAQKGKQLVGNLGKTRLVSENRG